MLYTHGMARQNFGTTRLPRPAQASGVEPYDTFQQVVEPYWPWATREYVVIDGALPLKPLTPNEPFPCTRSGFFKLTFLIALKEGGDRCAYSTIGLTSMSQMCAR